MSCLLSLHLLRFAFHQDKFHTSEPSIFNPTSKGNAFSTSFYLLNGSRQTLVLLRYYGLERLPKIISFNPPFVRLQSFLVRKVLLLLVMTFQDYYYFKPYLNI